MKHLKQILPLYLGQKVGANGQYFRLIPEMLQLMALEIQRGDYNLYLRPLSSMTEEEAREVCEFIDFDFKGVEIRHKMVIMYDIDLHKLTLSDDGEVQTPFPLNLELIPFLCSKGFDCFGLIQAGVAKDVTTIKK